MLKQIYIKAQHSNVKCAKCDANLGGRPAYQDDAIASDKRYCSRSCAKKANPGIYETIARSHVHAINKVFNSAMSVTHVMGGQMGTPVAMSDIAIEMARKQFWANGVGASKQNMVRISDDRYRIWMPDCYRDIILRPAAPVMALCQQPTPNDPGRDNMAQPSVHKYSDVVDAASALVLANIQAIELAWAKKVFCGSYSTGSEPYRDHRAVMLHKYNNFCVYVIPSSGEDRRQAIICAFANINARQIGVVVGQVVDGAASLV